MGKVGFGYGVRFDWVCVRFDGGRIFFVVWRDSSFWFCEKLKMKNENEK